VRDHEILRVKRSLTPLVLLITNTVGAGRELGRPAAGQWHESGERYVAC